MHITSKTFERKYESPPNMGTIEGAEQTAAARVTGHGRRAYSL